MSKNKVRISKGFWLWCQFSHKDMNYLKSIKSKVNKSFLGPKFDIHLTLVGPYLNLNNLQMNLIKKTLKKQKKISIKLLNYSYSKNKFTSLFIKVEKNKSLISLRKKFYKTNYLNKYSNYKPHISLFYGNKESNEKKRLILKLPKLIKKCIINKISIVNVDENINKWKIIKKIKLN